MRKTDLHPSLQATAQAIPDKGGCYAVVPNPAPSSLHLPECAALFVMARRELDLLARTLSRCPYADRLLRSLNRREAVDSSQIEGTRTSFDDLLLYEMEVAADASPVNADASETLAYVAARVNLFSEINVTNQWLLMPMNIGKSQKIVGWMRYAYPPYFFPRTNSPWHQRLLSLIRIR